MKMFDLYKNEDHDMPHERSKGTVNQVTIRSSEVLRTAVVINVPAIVILHNHPVVNLELALPTLN